MTWNSKTVFFVALSCMVQWSGSVSAYAAVAKGLTQFPEGERMIYTKLVEAFHHNQMAEVSRQRQMLERNYPTSVHLDNAFYLTGMLEFQNNRLGEALQAFAVVRNRFSKSNKRPSALFGMAMVYKRLNLGPQAHRVLQRVVDEYPGSPESQRAAMQLKMETMKSTLKR
jgi:TolA-binding protein